MLELCEEVFFVHNTGDALLRNDPKSKHNLQCFRHLFHGILVLVFLELNLPDLAEPSLPEN